MNNDYHEEQQPRYLEYLSFLYFLSSVFFLGALVPFQRTIWLTLICGFLISMPFIWLLHRIILRFGVGKLLLVPAALFAACLCALTFYCLSQFFDACVLQELPIWLFPAGLMLCCIYCASGDIHVLERFSKLAGPIIIALLFLALCSGASKVSLSMDYGFFAWQDFLPPSRESFLQGSIFFAVLFFIEDFVLVAILNTKRKTPAVFKSTAKGFIISIVFLSASYLVTVLALGPDVFELLTYPVYYPPGLTGTAEYLERIEVILLAVFIFAEFVKISLCLMMIKETLLLFTRSKDLENSRQKPAS